MRVVQLNGQVRREVLDNLRTRSAGHTPEYEKIVSDIVEDVRRRGDEALFEYTLKFDHVSIDPQNIRVTQQEIEEAYQTVDPALIKVIRSALANIRAFHEKQKRTSWFESTPEGTLLGQKIAPLEKAGVYVPGGKAVYPSTVLMNVVPAKVAGVDRVIMVTPPGKDGKVNAGTLVAAHEAGTDEIYKVGGAQAIAALAFGTASIPRVDKITGPGNIFVALAKRQVFGNVSIDSIAGPSEIMVLADETANAKYVAADLLSQAEHDEMASAILVTTSEALAKEVSNEIDLFLEKLSREREAIRTSSRGTGSSSEGKD